MRTRDVILAELRAGDRTTGQLALAAGVSRVAIDGCLRYMGRCGFRVVNLRRRGGHHDALWRLVHDPTRPSERRCAAEGCPTLLSGSNPTPYCRRHLADVAAIVCLERMLALDLDDLLEATEQLSLL